MRKIIKKITRYIEPMIKKAYISIVEHPGSHELLLRVYKKGELIEEDKRLFSRREDGGMSKQLLTYLDNMADKYGYCYVGTHLSSINVGAISGCSEADFARMQIDLSGIERCCIDRKWSMYSSHFDLDELKGRFTEVGGVDYIFSLESVIHFWLRKNPPEKTVVYILNHSTSLTLSIFNPEMLVYSSHFIICDETEADDLEMDDRQLEEMDDLLDESEQEIDELEEVVQLDQLGDDSLDSIEDLDSFVADSENPEFDDFDDISEFDDFGESETDDFHDEPIEEIKTDVTTNDYRLFDFIRLSIEDYYKNELYNSDFLEQCVLFDSNENSSALRDFAENELLLQCQVVHLNLVETINDLIQDEADSDV